MTLPALISHRLAECEKAYLIRPNGDVYSKTNWRGCGERLMKPDLNSHGYLRVRLTVNGNRKVYLVHKLVVEKYLGPRPTPQHEVCHLDGNKQNNNVSNLRWGTRKENAADRTKHGNCKASQNGKRSAKKTSQSMKELWNRKRSLTK